MNSGAPAGVIHVHEHWDTHAARAVSALGDGDRQTVILDVPEPGAGQMTELAEDLAEQLGHQPTCRSSVRVRARERTLAALTPSLIGLEPGDVVINRAHWLPPAQLQRLLQTLAATDARVWIITEPGLSDDTAHVVGAWCGTDTLTWQGFFDLWEQRAAPLPPASTRERLFTAEAEYPAVPEAGFTHFRTALADLTEHEQALVTAEWSEAHRKAQLELAYELHGIRHLSDPLNRDRMLAGELLHHLVNDVLHDDAAITVARLRGLQAGLLLGGWHLDVNLSRFLSASSDITNENEEPDLTPLLQHRDCSEVAAATLAALGLSDQQAARHTLRDVASDGSIITVHGRPRPVHGVARQLLAAARHIRENDGARPGDTFHAWPITPPFPNHIRAATAGVLHRHGINVGRHATIGIANDDRKTMTAFGLGLACVRGNIPVAGLHKAQPAGATVHARVAVAGPAYRRRLSTAAAAVLYARIEHRPAPKLPHALTAKAHAALRLAGLVDGDGTLTPVARYNLGLE